MSNTTATRAFNVYINTAVGDVRVYIEEETEAHALTVAALEMPEYEILRVEPTEPRVPLSAEALAWLEEFSVNGC